MVLTYAQCVEKYGNDYMIKKEIEEGRLFKKEKGIYSTIKWCSDLEIIATKYPRAIFTGRSAYYYHSLTDTIPDYYYLATVRTDTRIKNSKVKQTYLKEEIFDMGKIQMHYNNSEITVYSLERMLIELMRFKNKMPFDYYKEIISNYRNRVYSMDIVKVEEYASMFKNGENLLDMIQMEVF